jgi:hypothetical protein
MTATHKWIFGNALRRTTESHAKYLHMSGGHFLTSRVTLSDGISEADGE